MDKQPRNPDACDDLFRKRDADRLEQFETLGAFDTRGPVGVKDDSFGGRLDVFLFPVLVTITSVVLAAIYAFAAVQLELHLLASQHFIAFCIVLALSISLPLGLIACFREDRKWRSHQAIRSAAAIDPLTGVLNRRAFKISVDQELNRMVQTGTGAAIILFDLDHFKQLNDRFGHDIGDGVLTKVAAAVYGELRNPFDRLARWGGEEFIILLHDVTEENAIGVSERIRRRIELVGKEQNKGQHQFTASFGGSVLNSNQTFDVALSRADTALYAAKASGRNCVEFQRLISLAT